MVSREELLNWVKALPEDAGIGIDDGGLCLVTEDADDDYYEIGGMPDEADERDEG